MPPSTLGDGLQPPAGAKINPKLLTLAHTHARTLSLSHARTYTLTHIHIDIQTHTQASVVLIQEWLCTPIILGLGRQKEDHTILGFTKMVSNTKAGDCRRGVGTSMQTWCSWCSLGDRLGHRGD